ncbi:hypothetical protein [Rhizobium favelukesii]|uniref:hypothetical protein n=1 Tax=Rhizobium favelukesii TaxID=348824 RepID=UPI001FCFB10E|nr:hypothetical protein [Rhizobium favelukesii]MCS0461368.1 hypothetical protein [Rhizobium favelukesii]
MNVFLFGDTVFAGNSWTSSGGRRLACLVNIWRPISDRSVRLIAYSADRLANHQNPYMRSQRKLFVAEIKKTRRVFQGCHQKATFLWRRPTAMGSASAMNLRWAHDQTTNGNRMVSRNLPHEYFFLNGSRCDGPVIGHIDGRPIPARVVDIRGSRYRFVGIARRDRRGRLDVSAFAQERVACRT